MMAIPAGFLAKKLGYKGGIIAGLAWWCSAAYGSFRPQRLQRSGHFCWVFV